MSYLNPGSLEYAEASEKYGVRCGDGLSHRSVLGLNLADITSQPWDLGCVTLLTQLLFPHLVGRHNYSVIQEWYLGVIKAYSNWLAWHWPFRVDIIHNKSEWPLWRLALSTSSGCCENSVAFLLVNHLEQYLACCELSNFGELESLR